MPRDNRRHRRAAIARRLPRAARWLRMADQLRRRHERVAGRHRRLALVLLRRVAPLHVILERRRDALRTGPRLELAIGLFLRLASDGGLTRRDARPASVVLATRSRAVRGIERSRAGTRVTGDRHGRIEYLAVTEASAMPTHTPSPLVRLVRRASRAAEDVQETVLRLMPRSGRTLLRSVASRDRVEWPEPQHRRRGRLLQRPAASQAPTPSFAVAQEAARGRRTHAASASARVAFDMGAADLPVSHASQPARGAAIPAVNVDDLTERVVREIDRRIVAHRERHGRSF